MARPKAAPIHEVRSRAELARLISGVLRRALAQHPDPIRHLAKLADCNVVTAKGWWRGTHCPKALYALRLAVHIPELAAEIDRLCGGPPIVHPEVDAAMHRLMEVYKRTKR